MGFIETLPFEGDRPDPVDLRQRRTPGVRRIETMNRLRSAMTSSGSERTFASRSTF